MGVKKIFCHNLVLLLLIYKIKKILKWNLEGVNELELEKDFGLDYYVFNIEENPQNLKEILTSPDTIFWKEAVNDKIESLISNRT